MYFHAPRGVVLYFVGCKLYTDKEKQMFAHCPPSSKWVPGGNTGKAKGGEERNWPPYLTISAAQDNFPSNGHSPDVRNRIWDAPLPFFLYIS